MNRDTELALLYQLSELDKERSPFLDEAVSVSPVERYTDPARFAAEQARIFMRLPMIIAHASELPEPGSFLSRDLHGRSVLLTRDAEGAVRAFHNVCRHRGTRLVSETCGKARRFSCPYHAWTWNNQGDLTGVPHEATGFPELDRAQYGLKQILCTERYGFVWICFSGSEMPDIEAWLGDFAADFEWFGAAGLVLHDTHVETRAANWKILTEGGIEAYHFKVAHRKTIGPHFPDNLSSYQMSGLHMRSILPKNEVKKLSDTDPASWDIRKTTNILYTFLPGSQMLLMDDHVAWVHLLPQAADRTVLRINTLVPREGQPGAKSDLKHWQQNHRITCTTLTEDFDLNESAQAGLLSGVNDHLTFGRFEGALDRFNRSVESCL